jgi:hypothetical protein
LQPSITSCIFDKKEEMKITLAANQEIKLADLLNNVRGFAKNAAFTVKITNLAGDLSIKEVAIGGEAVTKQLHIADLEKNLKGDLFSFNSLNGCEAEFDVWQTGKIIS